LSRRSLQCRFTFVYSPRKGTVAAEYGTSPRRSQKREDTAACKAQNAITGEISREYLGKTYEILVENINPKVEGSLCGRTDSGRLVTFAGDKSLLGGFVNVKVTKTRTASLFGEINEQ
jgi:tRNA-2-methylthio-N6-dimethylallyladenosine synthase